MSRNKVCNKFRPKRIILSYLPVLDTKDNGVVSIIDGYSIFTVVGKSFEVFLNEIISDSDICFKRCNCH